MLSQIRNQRFLWLTLLLACFGLGIIGCEKPSSDSVGQNTETKSKLPKMKFHRPKSFEAAAERLHEIHHELEAEGELPEPKEFSVVEIIHGEGKSAHSHFYLESKYDPKAEDDDHHEGMKESKKLHKVKLDIFTEFQDIVQWTPNIAAAAELAEADWNTVNKTCKSMKELIEKQFGNAKTDAEKQKAYQEVSEELHDLISKLETLATESKDEK